MTSTDDLLVRAQYRSSVEIIRSLIAGSMIAEYALVKEIEDETHISVVRWYLSDARKESVITGVELLRLGSSSVQVSVVPRVGDIVLLIGSKHFVGALDAETREDVIAPYGTAYTVDTYKALQIYTASEEPIVVINIDGDASSPVDIAITGNTTIAVDGDVALTSSKCTINGHLEVKS